MKQYKIIPILCVLSVILTVSSPLATSADRSAFAAQKNSPISSRIIVKLKPARQLSGLNAAQIAAELRKPLSSELLNKLQAAAGVTLSETHAMSDGAHIIRQHGAPDGQRLKQTLDNIRGLSEVDYAEEDRFLTAQAATSDTDYLNLWGLHPVSAVTSPAPGASGNYGADFQTAWDTTTGSGVVVAVVDTGITAHDDIGVILALPLPVPGNLASAGYDFITDCRIRNTCLPTTADASAYVAPSADASDLGDFINTLDSTTPGSLFYGLTVQDSTWHGTHVSGTVAAIGNNAIGVVGGAYSAKILPVRALGKGGGYVSDISEGVRWAAGVHSSIGNPNPAKVINMSLGGNGSCGITQQNAINAAVTAGAVVIVAAGNSNEDIANHSPSNCNNVISVAAIARDGSRAAYSNFSSTISNTTNPPRVTLAAQGGDTRLAFDPGIYSTFNAGLSAPASPIYGYKQGTSMATPHVSAAAALMLARNAALTPAQIKTILSATATIFPSFSPASWAPYDCATLKNCGAGILNANLAVQGSLTPFSASVQSINFGTLTTNDPVSQTVILTNSLPSPVTLGTTTIVGENAASFSITGNTCTGTIAAAASCQISVRFSPTSPNTHSGGIYIPAQPATTGSIAVGLTGVAASPLSAATALPATKSNISSSSGGGCSIMPPGSQADISLLLAMLIILPYSFRQRLIFTLGKT